VDPKAGVDGYGKYRSPPGFDPRTIHSITVAVPPTLSRAAKITSSNCHKIINKPATDPQLTQLCSCVNVWTGIVVVSRENSTLHS
jgi:hypothetical protein